MSEVQTMQLKTEIHSCSEDHTCAFMCDANANSTVEP